MLTIGELVGNVEDLVGEVGNLGLDSSSSPRLFGSSEGRLLREEIEDDEEGDLLGQDTPVLESADFHYGDIRTTKENDQVVLNAAWNTTTFPNGKIEVEVAGRSFLGESPSFTAGGDWTPALQDGLLSYQSKYGRVLRFRFTASGLRRTVFSAFSESVYLKRAEA